MSFLLRHIQLNELSNVRVVQAALADVPGLHHMSVDYGSYEDCLCALEQTPLLVPTITQDTFEAGPPDLIKIDVEGGRRAECYGARAES